MLSSSLDKLSLSLHNTMRISVVLDVGGYSGLYPESKRTLLHPAPHSSHRGPSTAMEATSAYGGDGWLHHIGQRVALTVQKYTSESLRNMARDAVSIWTYAVAASEPSRNAFYSNQTETIP